MGNRKRTHGGRGILIAVVLGPLCAAAADLPGRVLATPAEPVANLPIQSLQHGKVASGTAFTIASRASDQKRRNSEPAPIADVNSSASGHAAAGPEMILPAVFHAHPRPYWLDNPTSTGP